MPDTKHEVDYERSDVETGSVAKAGAVVVVVSLAAAVAVLGLFNLLVGQADRSDPPLAPLARHEQGAKPPEPRLQEQPFKDIAELRAEERQVLETSAWIDEKAGLARIPVEDALRLVAQRGELPSWPKVAASPAPSPAPGGMAR